VVRSFINSSSAACTFISVVASSALVASSRIRMGGFFTNARAIERRWRSPPESIRPRSPTLAAKPSGLASMKSSACAFAAAARISSSVASGRPTRKVLADRAVEQQHLLEHHADVSAQRRKLQAAISIAVDLDRARLRIEHAVQERERRRLASPGRPTRAMISPGNAVNFRSVTAARLPS